MDDDQEIAGMEVYARPIDIARAFAKEIAITVWSLRGVASVESAHGAGRATTQFVADALESVMAVLQEAFPDETRKVTREARTEFQSRLRVAFPRGRLLAEDEIDAARAAAQKHNDDLARQESIEELATFLIRGGMGNADPVA